MRLLVISPADFAPLSRVFAAVDTIVANDTHGVSAAARHVDAILLAPRYGALLRETWPDLKHVRWVHALAAGVESLPFDLMRNDEVVVTNSKALYADALSEWVVAAMLWFAKDLGRLVRQQRAHRWEPFTVERLEGKTVGVIGYGGIGSAIGRRARALGMEVYASRRSAFAGATEDPIVSRWFRTAELDALIAASDYLAIATPLTDETRSLLDARRIAVMKRDAVIINVSRGAVVDESAMIDALTARLIRGAALDVFSTEPLPETSPLWNLENVLMAPHSADHTADSHDRAVTFFLENLARYQRGESLRNHVDKHAGY